MRELAGTRFSALFALISWKRMPRASGASNVRTTASPITGSRVA